MLFKLIIYNIELVDKLFKLLNFLVEVLFKLLIDNIQLFDKIAKPDTHLTMKLMLNLLLIEIFR